MRTGLALLLFIWGAAIAQGYSLRGEAGMDTGVRLRSAAGGVTADVPVAIRARLEVDVSLAPEVDFGAVLLPAFGSGATPDEPLASLGLQEAMVEVGSGAVDVAAGFQRLPLGQTRLIQPVSVEPRLLTGEPRGVLAVRALAYGGSWRVGAAALGLTGDDLIPDGAGALASARYESPLATVEGHLLWTVRPALGLTASASVGQLVIYGDAWLLATPWDARGGIGLTGYLDQWLWTAEAGWAPDSGSLRSAAGPVLAASLSRPVGASGAVDATVIASWPHSLAEPGRRSARVDAAVALRHDEGDASLSMTPALQVSEGFLTGTFGVSLRAYF